MAQTTKPDPTGDTPKVIEDKVRDLPANQGLNEFEMWQKIDAEVVEAQNAGKLRSTEGYKTAVGDKHGKK